MVETSNNKKLNVWLNSLIGCIDERYFEGRPVIIFVDRQVPMEWQLKYLMIWLVIITKYNWDGSKYNWDGSPIHDRDFV